MAAIDGNGAIQLFSATQVNYQQLEYYAGNTLNRGIELYKKKYSLILVQNAFLK